MIKYKRFKEIDSTNDFLKKLVGEKQKNWLVVHAKNQLAGRGYQESRWETTKDENLTFSFGLIIDNSTSILKFNFWLSNTICSFLRTNFNDNIKIKWPNDLLLNDKKVGGILIEKTNNYLISGIGINLNQKVFPNLENASSLLSETGVKSDIEALLKGLMSFIYEKHKLFKSRTLSNVLAHYNESLYMKNKTAKFKKEEKIFYGVIIGVDKEGRLHLALENGDQKKFLHKEISMIY